MADNPTTTLRVLDALENAVAGSGKVRTTDLGAAGHLQHVRLDLGSGVSEAQATATVPVSGTVTESNTANLRAATASNPGSQVSVVSTAGGTEVLAANAARKGYRIYYPAAVHTSYGGTPSSTTFALPAGSVDEMTDGLIYTGAITSIADTGTVVASVVEW